MKQLAPGLIMEQQPDSCPGTGLGGAMICFRKSQLGLLPAARAREGHGAGSAGQRIPSHGVCSKLRPRSITQASPSAAQRANCMYQLMTPSFSHAFLKAASKTKHLL